MFEEFDNDGFTYNPKGDQNGWHGQTRRKTRNITFRLPFFLKWIIIIFIIKKLIGTSYFSWVNKHLVNNYEIIGLIAIVAILFILFFVLKRIFKFFKRFPWDIYSLFSFLGWWWQAAPLVQTNQILIKPIFRERPKF